MIELRKRQNQDVELKERITMLTGRLSVIAEMVITNQPVADIGSDHAWLPIYMVARRLVPQAIGVEAGAEPFRRACKAVQASGCASQVEMRFGNGLQPLGRAEAATVVIAGLGGDTIVEILAHDIDKARSFKKFILQPMSRPEAVRGFMSRFGWLLTEERLVEEKGRCHIIIGAEPGDQPYSLSQLQLDIGPLILRRDDLEARNYLGRFLLKYKLAERELAGSVRADAMVRAGSYRERIKELEEILNEGQS